MEPEKQPDSLAAPESPLVAATQPTMLRWPPQTAELTNIAVPEPPTKNLLHPDTPYVEDQPKPVETPQEPPPPAYTTEEHAKANAAYEAYWRAINGESARLNFGQLPDYVVQAWIAVVRSGS